MGKKTLSFGSPITASIPEVRSRVTGMLPEFSSASAGFYSDVKC